MAALVLGTVPVWVLPALERADLASFESRVAVLRPPSLAEVQTRSQTGPRTCRVSEVSPARLPYISLEEGS